MAGGADHINLEQKVCDGRERLNKTLDLINIEQGLCILDCPNTKPY